LIWPGQLNAIAQQLNPKHSEMFAGFAAANEYYWSVCESEWATDIGFRGSTELQRLVPQLLELGIAKGKQVMYYRSTLRRWFHV
jgi:hypothetical protein